MVTLVIMVGLAYVVTQKQIFTAHAPAANYSLRMFMVGSCWVLSAVVVIGQFIVNWRNRDLP
jgi:hypothetical protein